MARGQRRDGKLGNFAAVRAAQHHLPRRRPDAVDSRTGADRIEGSQRVRPQSQAGTVVARRLRPLENGHLPAETLQTDGGGQTRDTRADDGDPRTHRGILGSERQSVIERAAERLNEPVSDFARAAAEDIHRTFGFR